MTVIRWMCSRAAAVSMLCMTARQNSRVALGGEADAEGPCGDRAEAIAVDAGAGALEQAAVDECAEQAEDSGLRQAGAIDDLAERKLFAEMAERLEDIAGAQHGERFVAVAAPGSGGGHLLPGGGRGAAGVLLGLRQGGFRTHGGASYIPRGGMGKREYAMP